MELTDDQRYGAGQARDARFDGWFFTAVTTTRVYCRPSCPSRTPKRENVRFFGTAAAAEAAGFRACKRCRPDVTPGSPAWDAKADLVGRAMRLIADGVVDREGVAGLARRTGYTERHIHRQLVQSVGVGPLALARSQRARTARLLLETTDLPIARVAFAAGFASVRQFNATMREVFAIAPRDLRGRPRPKPSPAGADGGAGGPVLASVDDGLALRLPYRAPIDAAALIAFFAARAVRGVEDVVDATYRRSLRLPHGAGVVALKPANGHVDARLWLDDVRDLGAAVQRCRRLLDLDSDPIAIAERLGDDAVLGPLVRRSPGRRVAGHVDGDELAVRAVLGQQVSLAGAATLAARLVVAHGEPLAHPAGAVTHVFPTAEALAAADLSDVGMPGSRRAALRALAESLASGELTLDAGADREDARRRLLALPGIGPWTAGYVAMRALRDPDAFLPQDLGVRHALHRLGLDGRPGPAAWLAERWRPYRAYALQHLWGSLSH